MSKPTPEELERARRALLDSARAERPDSARRAAGLANLQAGRVTDPGVEAPTLRRRRAAWWWGGLALVLAALLAWLWRPAGDPSIAAERPDAGVPEIGPPLSDDAGADAGAPGETAPTPPDDAGVREAPALDAGVTRKKSVLPPRVEEEADTLAAELALLDEARAQLPASPSAALAVLDRHRARFPNGALTLEADLVRVEALVTAGRTAEARKLAARLTRQHPGGLVDERVRKWLPDAG